jgi:hypothetical protein
MLLNKTLTMNGGIINGGIRNNENLTLNATQNGVGLVLVNPLTQYYRSFAIGSLNPQHPFVVNTSNGALSIDVNSSRIVGGGNTIRALKHDESLYLPLEISSNRLYINNGDLPAQTTVTIVGKLGVNTTSPSGNAQISGRYGSLKIDGDSVVNTVILTEPSNNILRLGNAYEIEFRTGSLSRMLIGQDGNVSIGGGSASIQFDITQRMRERGLGAGTLMTDANGIHYVISDPKLKTDIRQFTSGLSKILAINPITYKFNSASGLDTANDYTGFDAAQLRTSIPEAVFEKGDVTYEQVKVKDEITDAKTGEITEAEYETVEKPVIGKDGKQTTTLSISDRAIIAVQVNAIKELNAKIEAQNQTIVKQEARIAALEKKVGIVKP